MEETVCVETRELHSSSDSSEGGKEMATEWGTPRGRAAAAVAAVPLSEIGKPSPPPRSRERAVTVGAEDGGEGVKGEDMV